MQGHRSELISLKGIPCQETTGVQIVISIAQELQVQIRIPLLARVEIDVDCRAGGVEQSSVPIVNIGVTNTRIRAGQEPYAAVAVVAVEGDEEWAQLALADEVQA